MTASFRALCASLLLLTPALAATDDQIDAAVTQGVQFLETQQQQDGSFQGHWDEQGYKTGETALALLTLLKGGMAPDHPRIERGFAWLRQQPLKRTYEVSLAVLALEARYTPEAQASIQSKDPLTTQIRKRFQKHAPNQDRRWLQQAVDFLIRNQDASGLWKYPTYGEPDLSNAQFAVLALAAAARMGCEIDPAIYLKTVDYLLTHQESDGPSVAGFPVPAAERSLRGLLDRRVKPSDKHHGGTHEREAPQELSTATPMKARGWAYRPGAVPRGSMTAAGLAVLVIAKSALEGAKGYERLGGKIDQALRDGAAWLAHGFRVDRNPGAEPDWLFYYLYTLERAGTLLALDRFGSRDWYAEGADVILGHQQPDGRITADTGGQSEFVLAGTCLALLFLKRSTVPVIKRVMTGGDGGVAQGQPADGPSVRALGDGRAEVVFRFPSTPGRRVALAGSFNGWSKDADLLQDPDGDGVYELTKTLPQGHHTYKFVVDGSSWYPDPHNTQHEPDGVGGENSVLEIR